MFRFLEQSICLGIKEVLPIKVGSLSQFLMQCHQRCNRGFKENTGESWYGQEENVQEGDKESNEKDS